MDDDEELDRLLAEFGFQPSRVARDVPDDDSTSPRWDELDDGGIFE